MEMEALISEFRDWLTDHEITDVEIEEHVGQHNNITMVTFPIDEGGAYVSYDIIASISEEDAVCFYVEYCDIPDVDELELLHFVNDLNVTSPLTFTVEDGMLCIGYTMDPFFIAEADQLAQAFFFVWESIDAVRDDIHEAFGLLLPDEEISDSEEDA